MFLLRGGQRPFSDTHLTGQITADGLGGGGADSCLGVTGADEAEGGLSEAP